jgi:hypothetical protein
MAQFTRTHGDYQPVMNYDLPGYTVGAVNAVTSGETVQPQGPKLDFFTVTKDTGAFTTANINSIVQTLQQLATIYIYEYTDTSNDTFAVAVYPTGAWDASSIDTAVTAAGVSVTVAAGATFGA